GACLLQTGLNPCSLFLAEDEVVYLTSLHRMYFLPADIPTAQDSLVSLAVEGKDPLLTMRVLEVAHVEIWGLVAERRRRTALGHVLVVDRQIRWRHGGNCSSILV